jgi:hypothetical protein
LVEWLPTRRHGGQNGKNNKSRASSLWDLHTSTDMATMSLGSLNSSQNIFQVLNTLNGQRKIAFAITVKCAHVDVDLTKDEENMWSGLYRIHTSTRYQTGSWTNRRMLNQVLASGLHKKQMKIQILVIKRRPTSGAFGSEVNTQRPLAAMATP